jgi:hypothetical protein
MDDLKKLTEFEDIEVRFRCRYRLNLPTGPQDCEWPHCGCDPVANRILEHFQECGLTLVSDSLSIGASKP